MTYFVPTDLVITHINPITQKPYDDSWIICCLIDSENYQMMCGSENSTVYVLKISKKYSYWKFSICDFVSFYEFHNKNIIISIDEKYWNDAQKAYTGHCFNDNFLRKYESKILVHSTTLDNWNKIKKCGCLKSWNKLKSENTLIDDPIGQKLGDPKDFNDYIMFSNGSVAGEIVVLSKQNNKIIMDENMNYNPGARLYFDMSKIAQDGLLIRDGEHLKVKDSLSLNPYLIWYATYETIGLSQNISTPKQFAVECNTAFNRLFKYNIQPEINGE